MKKVQGNIVDPIERKIFPAEIHIKDGKIENIVEIDKAENYILPGFIDSHIHIESSMVNPYEFAKVAAQHGTVAVVSDPHEIANVKGVDGINFMIENAKKAAIKFYFGAPSCVPATSFETSGAHIDAKEIDKLLQRKDIHFLSEMMNYPGVLFNDKEVLNKIDSAKKYNKPIDGHAPGLSGEDLKKYINAGISTDHEVTNRDEAEEKIANGMFIQIRNGSASNTFDELFYLIDKYPDKVMLCSDDLHPEDLLKGHINRIVKKAIEKGCDIYNVVMVSSFNPILHYKLDVGKVKIADNADFIVVNNLKDFDIISNYVNGEEIYNAQNAIFIKDVTSSTDIIDSQEYKINKDELVIENQLDKNIRIIDIIPNSITTGVKIGLPRVVSGKLISDTEKDILKIIVVNRYKKEKPSIAFIHNFGLKNGAVASSIAHDSHNIISIGANDDDIVKSVNKVLELGGGIVYSNNEREVELPLSIAGLMSDKSTEVVAQLHREIETEIINNGSNLLSPLMTLSFLALPVIPELKITDKGLFDVNAFNFVSLFVD